MNNFITLDQYRAIVRRNILSEPQMLVTNQTFPLGLISFQCPGDNFQLKDITIPATRNAVDLTQFAPLENLLACSQLKSLLQVKHLGLLNPEEMPKPQEGISEPNLSQAPLAGATSVDGKTIPNATVIVEQQGNIWTGVSDGAGVFNVNVSGLKEGPFSITVTADGHTPARYNYEAGPQPLNAYPNPTVNAVYNDTKVTGKTVADANITVAFGSKTFTGQADDQGNFNIATDKLPFQSIDLHFEAEGYLPFDNKVQVAQVAGIAQVSALKFLDTKVTGKASPNAQVELVIAGQSNQFAQADAQGNWTATVQPVQGEVTARTLEVDGYDEAIAKVTPTKLKFGAITIDDADKFGENRTTVSGTIAGLNPAATDIAITVTMQAGIYEGNVNLNNGTFTINGVDAKAGTGSTGVVTVESAFYDEATQSFNILEEFKQPKLLEAVDGQTSVVGETVASASVKITMNGETKTASANPQGAFSVGGFTNVHPGQVTIALTKNGYLPASFTETLVVKALGQLDHDLALGEETVTGMATPGSTVKITQGEVSGDAVADASTGTFSVTLSGPLVAGQVQLLVQHAGYVDYTETFTVA